MKGVRLLIIAGIVGGNCIACILQCDGNRGANTARTTSDNSHSAHVPLPHLKAPLFRGAQVIVGLPAIQRASKHIATPMPPPMQRVASPFFAPRRFISKRSVLSTR